MRFGHHLLNPTTLPDSWMSEPVDFSIDQNARTITLFGNVSRVEKLLDDLKVVETAIAEEICKRKETVTEKLTISTIHVDYLKLDSPFLKAYLIICILKFVHY